VNDEAIAHSHHLLEHRDISAHFSISLLSAQPSLALVEGYAKLISNLSQG